MSKYVENTWLATVACCNCGMVFAMPADYQERRLNDHEWFYCPSGHRQHYTGQTEAQRLKHELERKERALDLECQRSAEAREDRDRIARAHRRMRTRVANGVCPCCNRSFENLRKHMQSQHPEFSKPQTMRALREAFGMTQAQVAREIGVSTATVSCYETDKLVSVDTRERMEAWIEAQGVAA